MALMKKEVSIGGKASFWAFRPRPINHEIIQVNYTKKQNYEQHCVIHLDRQTISTTHGTHLKSP